VGLGTPAILAARDQVVAAVLVEAAVPQLGIFGIGRVVIALAIIILGPFQGVVVLDMAAQTALRM
jgi:hypothetical protein